MNENKKFQGLSENLFWLPLIQTMIEAHNMAWSISNGEDEKYCRCMMWHHDLLVPLYVDSGVVDSYTFNKIYRIFIYVLEFVYGDPYGEGNKVTTHYVSTVDYFNNIKKHWNDDISLELQKVERKKKTKSINNERRSC